MNSSNKAGIFMGLSILAILGLLLSLIGNFLWPYWASIITGIFKIVLIVILLFVEFRQSPSLVKPFSFMFYFLGRGVFYVILGFITIGGNEISLAGGIVLILVGIVYVVLHFAKPGHEPEYMSFARYQRLTSGITHDLPTSATNTQNVYPVAPQVPLATHNHGSFTNAGQYNSAHASSTHVNNNANSPLPTHTTPHSDLSAEKTEI